MLHVAEILHDKLACRRIDVPHVVNETSEARDRLMGAGAGTEREPG